MAAERKLKGEIDKTLKKVSEGQELFEDLWDQVHESEHGNQREKLEGELKKEIKKLQRLREQIKSWIASADIKDKQPLMDARKAIERDMERFKACERESKIKGINRVFNDPREKAKEETRDWINAVVEAIQAKVEECEFEHEELQQGMKKKQKPPPRVQELEELIASYKSHVDHLERLLRCIDNETIQPDELDEVKSELEPLIATEEENTYEGYDLPTTDDLYAMFIDRMEAVEVAGPPAVVGGKPGAKSNKEKEEADKEREREKAAAVAAKAQLIAQGNTNIKLDDAEEGNTGGAVTRKPVGGPSVHPGGSVLTASSVLGMSKLAPAPAPAGGAANPNVILAQVVAPPPPPSARSTEAAAGAQKGVGAGAAAPPSSPAPITLVSKSPQVSPRAPVSSNLDPNLLAPPPSSSSTHGFGAATAQPPANASRGPAGPAPPQPAASAAAAAHTGPRPTPTPASAPPLTNWLNATTGGSAATTATSTAEPAMVPGKGLPGTVGANKAPVGPSVVPIQKPASPAPPPPPRGQTDGLGPAPPPLEGILGGFERQQVANTFSQASNAQAQAAAASFAAMREEPLVLPPVNPSLSLQAARHVLEACHQRAMPQTSDTEFKRYKPRVPTTVPATFPKQQHDVVDNPNLFKRLDPECLFFAFYFQPESYQQCLSAHELKRQSWRFHKQHNAWFQRFTEPSMTSEEYEQGAYVYFDYNIVHDDLQTGWCYRRKENFTFRYDALEDELKQPGVQL